MKKRWVIVTLALLTFLAIVGCEKKSILTAKEIITTNVTMATTTATTTVTTMATTTITTTATMVTTTLATTTTPKVTTTEAPITEIKPTITTKVTPTSEVTSSGVRKQIEGISGIYQLPELPTGCEATALTILLNYYGFDVDKWSIAMEYLPRKNFWRENGLKYGPDPFQVFPGDPSTNGGYGCFIPCVKQTAENYWNANGIFGYTATAIEGQPLVELYKKVESNIPVLCIVSENLNTPYYGDSGWYLETGEYRQWQSRHHAMVLIGYDTVKDTVIVADPLYSSKIAEYSRRTFESVYDAKGQHALIIEQN